VNRADEPYGGDKAIASIRLRAHAISRLRIRAQKQTADAVDRDRAFESSGESDGSDLAADVSTADDARSTRGR